MEKTKSAFTEMWGRPLLYQIYGNKFMTDVREDRKYVWNCWVYWKKAGSTDFTGWLGKIRI